MRLPLRVINFWAGPGAGKSTTAAGLFNLMKGLGHKVELVTEVAKDLTYEQAWGTMDNELFLVGMQDQRLRRLVGHVDWAITDSPLPMCEHYASAEYRGWIGSTIESAFMRYDNYNFFVRRTKPFQQYGRRQTEAEAREFDLKILQTFYDYSTRDEQQGRIGKFFEIDGDPFAARKAAHRLGLYDGPTTAEGIEAEEARRAVG